MTDEQNISLGDVIFSDIDQNPYLNELYENILYNYSLRLFQIKRDPKEVNVPDALHFADVLSKSTNKDKSDRHKIWSQEIVALLKETQTDNPAVKDYLGTVLLSTENFRGLAMNAPNFQGLTLLDRFYTEVRREFLSIPAEKDKQFFRPQKEVYDRLTEPYFSYSGPTSMGKSFVMRMFIKKQVMDGKNLNFAILVPTKALINEVYSKIIDDLKIDERHGYLSKHNYTLVTSAGALQLKKDDMNFIFVLTPERLLYLLIGKPDVRIDYLFVDEAHKISAKDSRSAFYYKVVDMLFHKQKPHIIFSSPNIPNPEVYLKLLPYANLETDHKLTTSFSHVSQIKILVDLVSGEIKTFNSYTKNLDTVTSCKHGVNLHQIIASICCRPTGRKMQNIVYFNSKEKTVEHALEFAKTMTEQNDDDLTSLAMEIRNEVHSDYYLVDIITKGVAYHIGYLPASIRVKIERLYRDHKIHTLFCTSTLLEGVNLPADNLFITTYRKGRGRTKMTSVDFKNLVGRVGRINYNLYGNVFLVRLEENLQVKDFVELLEKDVPEQKLSLVTELKPKQKKQIIECLLQGNTELEKGNKQSQDSFDLTRKCCLILLRDIMKGRNSIVKRTFADYLTPDIESKIKKAFETDEIAPDDDINTSVDQTKSLSANIADGLSYPSIDKNGLTVQGEPQAFLEKLWKVFNWSKCESNETIGNFNRLRWYAVMLRRWISGSGLGMIIVDSLNYAQNKSDYKVRIGGQQVYYDHNSMFHRNIVMSETLQAIENVILFSFSNYFLKFSEAYKRIHNIEGDMKNDWYEYVEYGTTNPLTIVLQRNGFSRETAMYIRQHRKDYVDGIETSEPKLKRSLARCGNYSVELEVTDMIYNNSDLFVD
jgi:hypothetical protein